MFLVGHASKVEGVLPRDQPLRVVERIPRGTFSLLPAEVGSVSGQEASRRRRRPPMCYTRRDQGFEEEARRLRVEEDRRRRAESKTADKARDRPLTEKAKEMVGAK
jgi:hypothetical protein